MDDNSHGTVMGVCLKIPSKQRLIASITLTEFNLSNLVIVFCLLIKSALQFVCYLPTSINLTETDRLSSSHGLSISPNYSAWLTCLFAISNGCIHPLK